MKVIGFGDMVTVILSNKNHFSFQDGPRIKGCMVEHCAQDVGDLWKFSVNNEKVFSINPNSSDFGGLELEKKKEEIESEDLPF